MDESSEGQIAEGPPIEPIEELPSEISKLKDIASRALTEIKSIRLFGPDNKTFVQVENDQGSKLTMPEGSPIEAVIDLKAWLREEMKNSPKPTENIIQIMRSLRDSGFAMDDEKVSVRMKIYEITQHLDHFISDPNDFKVKYPDLTRKLIKFCEALSK